MSKEVLPSEETWERSPIVKVAAEDGSCVVSLYELETTEDYRSVEIEKILPLDYDERKVISAIAKAIESYPDTEPRRRFSSDALYDVDKFARAVKQSSVLKKIGYEADTFAVTQDDFEIQRTVATYPSTKKLNGLMSLLNGDSADLRFAEYEGGSYGVLEYIQAFAEHGQVFIASDQPFELHEHVALHIPGWIGLSGNFTKYTREMLGAYLSESGLDEILSLPPDKAREYLDQVPYYTKPLRAAISALDMLTTSVGEDYFLHHETKNFFPARISSNRDLVHFFKLEDDYDESYQDFFSIPTEDVISDMVEDIISKYEELEKVLRT